MPGLLSHLILSTSLRGSCCPYFKIRKIFRLGKLVEKNKDVFIKSQEETNDIS